MIIREVKSADSEKLSTLIQQVDQSSDYMLWEPGERNISPENQLKMIENIETQENSTILVSEDNDHLVGYILALGGKARRNRHSAYLVVGILKEYRGQGIGRKLLSAINQWATEHNIHRLELSAVGRNKAGLSLYKKMGFEIEGTKRDSLLIDGEFVDEYYMSKLL
ncbi:GNAT family N-acetyltransferase [Alkalibacillus silvisoli]|uniref:GNAT family protein n=1 Tax=Alkalibacillus silvisoli TaxID=392823 RepID=A0ABP3JX74_9BACI